MHIFPRAFVLDSHAAAMRAATSLSRWFGVGIVELLGVPSLHTAITFASFSRQLFRRIASRSSESGSRWVSFTGASINGAMRETRSPLRWMAIVCEGSTFVLGITKPDNAPFGLRSTVMGMQQDDIHMRSASRPDWCQICVSYSTASCPGTRCAACTIDSCTALE